jgi:predicted nicotinamide N-methyase
MTEIISRIKIIKPKSFDNHNNISNYPECDEVSRRTGDKSENFALTIRNFSSTSLNYVGFQIWTASLFLADYVINKQEEFEGKIVIELGCGCGLLGAVCCLFTKPSKIFLTDYLSELLELARHNVHNNLDVHGESLNSIFSNPRDRVNVHFSKLDWFKFADVDDRKGESSTISDRIQLNIDEPKVILSSDPIYDDAITMAFFRTVSSIMLCCEDILLLSIEKRLNFEIQSLSVVPHGYDLFLTIINVPCDVKRFDDCLINNQSANVEVLLSENSSKITDPFYIQENKYFRGELVFCPVEQNLVYNRNSYLELWKIKLLSSS